MLGDIDPALVTARDWNPVVYARRDNVTAARFVRYDATRRKDVPLDFSAVERMILVLPAMGVVFDSDAHPDVFDWGAGDGRVRFDLSDYAVSPGVYDAQLLVYDAQHPRGQVILSGYQTDRDFKLSFQQVEGSGETPPPHTYWTPEAPANGELYGRKNQAWFVLGSAATADVGAFATAAQGEKADTAVQPDDITDVVRDGDPRLTDPRAPTGAAGGVLSGSYPNPGFAVDMATQAELEAGLGGKVDKVAGKGLSTEDYTSAEKSKLAGIEAGAQVNVATNLSQGTRTATTVPVTSSTGTAATLTAATATLAGVMTSSDKAKLDSIAAGAQVNAVTSVAGKTGAVTLAKGDVGLGNVDNTSDAAKPVSTAQQAALNLKLDATATAADSSKLGGQLPSYYATAAQIGDIATALDLINGEVI